MLPAVVSVAALVSAGCGDVSLTSAYRSHPIVVDGRYDEWEGNLKFIERINMSVGAMNDDTNLYAILVIGDRETQQQVISGGLFLWFDPAGKNDRQFGIHYPLGMRGRRDGDDAGRVRGARPDAAGREAMEAESLEEVELVGAGGTARVTRGLDELPGLEVRERHERGALVVEYRIPLVADVDNPYGVGAVPGQVVGVGLVTPEWERPKGGEGMTGHRRPPGGRDRDGDEDGDGERPARETGGGPGMRPGGGMFDAPEPINLWAQLHLAAVPPATSSGGVTRAPR